MPSDFRVSPRNVGISAAAALPPVTGVVPRWAKVLYYLAESVAQGILWQQFDQGGEIQGTQASDTDPLASTWRRFAVKWKNTLSNDEADAQYMSFDIVNLTNGSVDGTWTAGDYTNVVAQLDALMTAVAALTPTWLTYDQVAGYIRAFNPYSVVKPFADTGPPEVLVSKLIPGTAGSASGPQICTTITERTPSRKHWGRTYLPTLGANAISGGRLLAASQDALGTAALNFYGNLMDLQFFPVVPTTVSGTKKNDPTAGGAVRTLQVVTGVRIDDVLDVIRRRRYHNALRIVDHPTGATTRPADEFPQETAQPSS